MKKAKKALKKTKKISRKKEVKKLKEPSFAKASEGKRKKEFINLNNVFKLSVISVVLLIGFSVFYYYFLFLPAIEKNKLEQEINLRMIQLSELTKQKTETQALTESTSSLLTNCFNSASETYYEIFSKALEECNSTTEKNDKDKCILSLNEQIKLGLKEAKDECYNQYSSSSQLQPE